MQTAAEVVLYLTTVYLFQIIQHLYQVSSSYIFLYIVSFIHVHGEK